MKESQKVIYTTSLDYSILNAFKKICRERGCKQNQILEDLIKQFVNKEGDSNE